MRNIFVFFFILSLGAVLTACTKPNTDTNQPVVNSNEQLINQNENTMNNEPVNNVQEEAKKVAPQYTLAEVATHNNANDCWLVASAKVYDVTNFIPGHPGGDKILQGCGKDMTEFFNTKHLQQSKEKLPAFYIADLKQ